MEKTLPENLLKYALLYLIPSGSFQKWVGMEGNGLVHTSSPLSSCTENPAETNSFLSIYTTPLLLPLTIFTPALHGHAKIPALNLSSEHRNGGVLAGKTGDNVRATCSTIMQHDRTIILHPWTSITCDLPVFISHTHAIELASLWSPHLPYHTQLAQICNLFAAFPRQ